MRPQPRNLDFARRIEWDGVITWLLCFGLVAYLGIEGGGFDALVYDQVGIGIWWIVAVGALVAALPRSGPSHLALAAWVLLAAFAAWTALSMFWTESGERTFADIARMLTYLGAFTLTLAVRAPREPRRLVAALAAAIALIGLIGLLSRLHPAWFPASAEQTARFLNDSRERLSYPLNYWNALGGLIAIGVPLLLVLAGSAKTIVVRGLAAAAVPPLLLALFYTLSRGGIGAAALAVVVFIAFSDNRVPKIFTALITGAGGAILIAIAAGKEQLRHGLSGPVAHDQGDEMLLIAVLVCAAVAVVAVLVGKFFESERRPAWTEPSREFSLVAVGAAVLAVIVIALAANAPDRISNAVEEFKHGGNAGTGAGRLNSFAGESRYELWKSAIDQNSTKPLTGTGSGTFVYWWDRDAAGDEPVQDAHSLYLQVLGELGIVGFLLLGGFVALVLLSGGLLAVRAGPELRPWLAAGLGGAIAFFSAAAIDWSWQMPVLPIAALMLSAMLVMAPAAVPGAESVLRRWPARIGLALGALIAVVAIAVPLASTSLIRSSEAAVRDGELDKALEDARSAQNVEPGAATPRLQQALVLELQGNLPAAAEAATEATERESTNWRTWLVLSRVEALQGNADEALAAYRKAKSLNPLSPLFDR